MKSLAITLSATSILLMGCPRDEQGKGNDARTTDTPAPRNEGGGNVDPSRSPGMDTPAATSTRGTTDTGGTGGTGTTGDRDTSTGTGTGGTDGEDDLTPPR